jgi:TP901 family phage tail tape measure protein
MTELRKVTDEVASSYDKFFVRASKRSVELATSLDKYIGSVADFARMGFSIPQAETLADAATIYYNVGDGLDSMSAATNSIISTLKAYNLEADQAARVTDIFNEVSNRFAVTSGGAGEAIQRAGAALATANTSLEKSVALWTAMNEIVQDDESSATSLRFIAQRMRNTAGELEEMGVDAEGAAESVTMLQQQILKLTGVNIMSDANTFRDVYDVLKDISEVWNDITDKDRADVIRLMAGTRQSAAFSALMQNFSTAESALDVALNSAGSAYRENLKWLNSIEAKQQKARAAFEAFSTSIMSSDLIKGYYDTQTGILGFLTTLTEQLGALPTLAAAAAAALSFKNIGSDIPLLAKKQGGVNPYMKVA